MRTDVLQKYEGKFYEPHNSWRKGSDAVLCVQEQGRLATCSRFCEFNVRESLHEYSVAACLQNKRRQMTESSTVPFPIKTSFAVDTSTSPQVVIEMITVSGCFWHIYIQDKNRFFFKRDLLYTHAKLLAIYPF